MKNIITLFILYLVLSVDGQITGPERITSGVRLYLEHDTNDPIVDFTMLNAGDFIDTQDNILWCQSANNGTMIGEWYFPNGNLVPTADDNGPLHIYHVEGQVGLLRDAGVAGNEGLYRCVIPDENDVDQTLWVGIYTSITYNDATKNIMFEGNTDFSLLSTSKDANPPVFSLLFVVTNLPPSKIVCEIDNSILSVADENINRVVSQSSDPVKISVTVTIRSRQSGSYQCGVTALGADGSATPGGARKYNEALDVTVTDTPVITQSERTALSQAHVAWSPPSNNNPIVQGYEVFYDLPNGTRLSEDVGNANSITISDLASEQSYPVFVVAHGGDLPSSASSETISTAVSLDVFPNSTYLIGENNVTIQCILNISIQFTSLELSWHKTSTNEDVLNSTILVNSELTNISVALDLTVDVVNANDAGIYYCSSTVNDSLGETASISRSHEFFVQIPPPTMSLSLSPSGVVYESTLLVITCNATLPDTVDTDVSATVSWTGPNGIVNSNGRITVDQAVSVDDNVFQSLLTFNPVDNGDMFEGTNDAGMYTCEMAISSSNTNVSSGSNMIGQNIIVSDLPNLGVNISTSGSTEVGQSLNITCSVKLVEGFVGGIDITWEKMDDVSELEDFNIPIITVVDGPVTNVTLILDPVQFNYRGVYMCIAMYNVTQTVDGDSGSDYINLAVNLPPPNVQVSTDPIIPDSTSLIEGTYIDLVCNASINNVDTDISVTVEWLRDGTAIVNGTDYSISELNLVNGYYISTVHIDELKTSDNNALITCLITAVPLGSTFAIGNNAIDDLTLIIREIQTNDITVDIIFSTVPTAGDQFNITCTATVPERLVHSPDSFLISYNLSLQMIVVDDNPDATQSSVSRSGNVFSRVVTIDPVKTSDAEMYYCAVTFVDLLGASVLKNKQLQVYIPTPAMSLALSPSDIIYESTLLVITCNATLPDTVDTDVSATVSWTGPNGIVNSNGRITVDQADSVDDHVYQSVLTFNPVDNGDMFEGTNDTGLYTCEMTITSSSLDVNVLVLSASNHITEDIAVAELPGLKVNVSTTEVGQNLNITCTVEFSVERLFDSIDITWEKTNDVSELEELNIPIITVVDGPVTNVTLILDPVQFNYRGVYVCTAMYNISETFDGHSESDMTILTVDFPPIDVTISQDRTDPLYTGTSLTISCDIILSSLVDIPVIVTNQWTRNGTAIMDEASVTDNLIKRNNLNYTAYLVFFPLYHITDVGEYQCSVNVSPDVSDHDQYITTLSDLASTYVYVHDLPNPVMEVILSPLIPKLGRLFGFVCKVSVVDGLIASPEISWSKDFSSTNNISVDPARYNNELFLNISSLNTSDAGRYTCNAELTFPQINATRSIKKSGKLIIQIPTPEVRVNLSSTGNTFSSGDQLSLFCDIAVNFHVDTPFIIHTTWTRTNGSDYIETLSSSSNNRVTVFSPSSVGGFNRYQSRIEFSTLSDLTDSGTYTCQVRVESKLSYVNTTSASAEEAFTVQSTPNSETIIEDVIFILVVIVGAVLLLFLITVIILILLRTQFTLQKKRNSVKRTMPPAPTVMENLNLQAQTTSSVMDNLDLHAKPFFY